MTVYPEGWYYRPEVGTAHFYFDGERVAICGMGRRKADHYGKTIAPPVFPEDFKRLEPGSKDARTCGACRQKVERYKKQ